jgi:flagellar biosynthesis protein FliP
LADRTGARQVQKTKGRKINPIAIFRLLQIRASHLAGPCESAIAQKRLSMRGGETRVPIRAFMISKSRRGCEIGLLIALALLVIGMIVSTLTMSMGMIMLPPSVIALPIKILVRFYS